MSKTARLMKDSGIEWIGEIPVGWDVIKLKYLFSIIGGNGFPEELQGHTEGDFPFCKVSDINGVGDYVISATNWVSNEVVVKCRFNIVPKLSIILAKIGAALTKNHRKINRIECCIDNNTQALVPKRPDNIRFLLYISKCLDMNWYDNKSTIPSVNNSKLLNESVPNIPLPEQTRIAAYLDEKCGKIDSITAGEETAIEKLKAYKQSIITETVTKGLDPKAPMKDSGIEWIGEIPIGWTAEKAKFHVKITNGSDPTSEGDVPVYGSGACSFKTCGDFKEGPCVLLGRKGATLHIPHYIEGKYWNVDTAFDVKVNPSLGLKYYYYLACCFDYRFYVSQTTLPGMTQTNYGNMFIPLPPLSEQKQIAAYLDKKCTAIDSNIASRQSLIEKLTAYKKSLIYEVVTGKKEV